MNIYYTIYPSPQESPFTMINDDPDDSGEHPYIGLCIDLLNQLRERLGFNYELYIVPDGNYGGKDAVTGQWNGMVEELLKDVSPPCYLHG
jgi:hypothetical protein